MHTEKTKSYVRSIFFTDGSGYMLASFIPRTEECWPCRAIKLAKRDGKKLDWIAWMKRKPIASD